MKQKTQRKAQWVVVAAAVVAALTQLTTSGVLDPQIAVYVLLATNIISAVLRSGVGKVE